MESQADKLRQEMQTESQSQVWWAWVLGYPADKFPFTSRNSRWMRSFICPQLELGGVCYGDGALVQILKGFRCASVMFSAVE